MRVQSQAVLHHRPGIDSLVKLYKTSATTFYNQFTRTRSTTNVYDRIATEGTFGSLNPQSEGNPLDFIDFRTPFYMDVTPIKYGGRFEMASETSESDKTGIISRKVPKLLRAADKAVESRCAGFMNLATSTAFATPDGVALASASHLYEGGTFSNIVTGNPALSLVSLELALQELIVQPDDSGDPMQFMGPYTLLVPAALAGLANRLVNAQKVPSSNNNDPNWAGSLINKVVVNPYFTSSTAWSLVAQGADNPLILLKRRDPKVKMYPVEESDAEGCAVTTIFAAYAEDPRGFIYSAGA